MPRLNLPGGISVSKFSLATGRRNKDQQSGEWKDITDWHNIVVWRTEHVAIFCSKVSRSTWKAVSKLASCEDKEGQKKYFTEVICNAQDLCPAGWRRSRSRRWSFRGLR